MIAPETIELNIKEQEENKIIQSKNYHLNLNADKYLLIINLYSNESIEFTAVNISNINIISSFYSYRYAYLELIKKFLLLKEHYDNSEKIINFLDYSINNNKIFLILDENNKILKLSVKREFENEVKECNIILDDKKMKDGHKINFLFKEMNELNIKIDLLKKENEMTKKLCNSINEKKDNIQKIHIKNNNSIDFSFHCNLINYCEKFTIFIGLIDNVEYLVYIEKKNLSKYITVVRIFDNNLIKHLKYDDAEIIKYYKKSEKEDYLLSCGKINILMVLDIQNDYNAKFKITLKNQNIDYFFSDLLLLFNINDNDYIITSSFEANFSNLIEFKSNKVFFKNIPGTEQNKTLSMIPWAFKNEYYLIECCENNISINNIFKEECYAVLMNKSSFSGFLYNDNFLCVSSYEGNSIKVWDLANKILLKSIEINDYKGRGILQWNNTYSIVGCENGFAVVNLKEGKFVKKICTKGNKDIIELKKIKLSQLGDCLICRDKENELSLYSLTNL